MHRNSICSAVAALVISATACSPASHQVLLHPNRQLVHPTPHGRGGDENPSGAGIHIPDLVHALRGGAVADHVCLIVR